MRTHEEEEAAMQERSGAVQHHSKLVSFLYQLMRDHVTPGEVERCVQASQDADVTYTNGWLANYAADIAKRLEDA